MTAKVYKEEFRNLVVALHAQGVSYRCVEMFR